MSDRSKTARYVASLTRDLIALAKRQRLVELAYLLELANLQANDDAQGVR